MELFIVGGRNWILQLPDGMNRMHPAGRANVAQFLILKPNKRVICLDKLRQNRVG